MLNKPPAPWLTHRLADPFNGWRSEPLTLAEAEGFQAATRVKRIIVPVNAVWGYDPRFSEWAWFYDQGQRIS